MHLMQLKDFFFVVKCIQLVFHSKWVYRKQKEKHITADDEMLSIY